MPVITLEDGGIEDVIQGTFWSYTKIKVRLNILFFCFFVLFCFFFFYSNLNGQYLNGPVPQEFEYKGMYWYDYQGPQYSLMKSKMMIRPFFNAVGLGAQSGGTTVKPRSPQVPTPPGNQGRPTLSPKSPNQQGQKPKKKKEME